MTHLIKQKSGNDCSLAALAMAMGAVHWENLWTQQDLDSVIASKGISNMEPWLKRVGLTYRVDYLEVYLHHVDQEHVRALLRWRRALLSVDSLNNEFGSHMIYWDGERVFDPSTQRTFQYLSSTRITRAIIFNDMLKDTP